MDAPAGFDFSAAVDAVCQDMCRRLPQLSHVDMRKVAVSIQQARNRAAYGIYASLTPLRFEQGATHKTIAGRRYGVQSVRNQHGSEYLYILSVYLPRFMNTTLEEKLLTLLHELWHISPEFDGDLRRHEGRCYAHGPSQAAYDAKMAALAQQWLAADPPATLYAFLDCDFAALAAEHGGVIGRRWRTPRLVAG